MPTLTQFKLAGTPCFAKIHPSVTRLIQERFDGYHQSGMDIKQAMESAVSDHLKGLELDRKGMVDTINSQLRGTYADLLAPKTEPTLREKFIEKAQEKHTKSDIKRFLKDVEAKFGDTVTEYRKMGVVAVGEKVYAWSGDTGNFLDITPEPNVTATEEIAPERPVQPYSTEDHKTFIRSLVTGETTVDSLQSAYKDLLANKDQLLQDLAKLKKDELLKKLSGMAAYRYKNDKKEYVVKAVYSAMEELFTLGRSLVYSPFGDGKDKAMQALVDSTTADDLKAFAARFKKKEPVTRTTSTAAIDTPMSRTDNGYYLSSGDTNAMFTLRKRVNGIDRYVTNLATDKTQAAWAADEWIGVNETDEAMKVIYTGEVADDLRDIDRSAPVQKPFDADAMDDPRPEAERIEDMTPADILAKNGLVVEQKTAKSGKTYWAVSGNTKQHQTTLDALGFAKPFKMGATWYRSVFDADPSERLANALVGTVEVKAYETLERDDATFYIQTKAGLSIVNENGKWYARGKNTYDFREALNEAGGRWINKTWGYEFNEDPTERLGATIKALVERAATGEGPAADTGNGIHPDEYERLQQLRNREDERADERITAEAIDGLISEASKDLIRRGIAFGVPAEVAADQIEDVAAINAAYRNKKPLYLLANGAGTGKTFVLGAAVRELRASGAAKFLYITQSQDLISQIQRDLAAYGIDDVKFHTYAELSNKSSAPIDAAGAVLIFDEAHNVKNVEGETARGLSGQKLMAAAEFTILASATPYQNPVEARYLAGTGIFNSVGGFEEWAKMYGAAVRRYKRFNYQTGQNEVEEVVYWPGRGKKKDGAAARQWMFKQGVMANRPMKIDASMVDTQFRREKVDQKWVDLYDQVNAAYDDIINQWLDDDGNPRDAKITAEISRHRENAIKRVLESSKTNAVIARAKELLADGKNVVVFVETKSERVLGKWRRSQHFKDDTLYTYPQMQEMMLEWQAEAKMAQMMNERPPSRPFAAFIVEIARTFHEFNLLQELPSTADEIQSALKEHGVGIYTGDVTPQAATKNKTDFLAGRLKVLVATMAKGGTGLSLHDTVGTRPTVQLNLNLPWAAWQVDQVAARVARYGLKSKAVIEWLFASNIPWETTKLAPRVGARMSDMGAIVNGVEMKSAEKLLGDFDFEGVFDVKQAVGEGIIDLEADAGSPDFGTDEYAMAQRLENNRLKASDTSNGYFATPYPLAVLMKRIAGIRDGERVLEPSAGGIGALIKFLPATVHVTAVEQRLDNYESLQRLYGSRSNTEINRGDFMEFRPSEMFDAILMNPPFERKEGVGAQDVAHVMKAFDHLAPGGRLVAIMGEGAFFRNFKQETAFREWLDEVGATVIKMPEGAFRKSGTMVRTRMLVIDKDNADFRSDLSLGDMNPDNLKAVEAMVPARVNDEPSFARAQRRQPVNKVMPKSDITAYVEELVGNGVKLPWLKVVDNVSDLPFKAPDDAKGARLGNTIYVVASNIVEAADVRAVVFHESVGHYGLNGFFGAKIWSALDAIHKNNPLIQEYAAAWVKSNGDVIKEQQLSASAARYRSIEEAMARMAEANKPYTYALSLVRKVQELLRTIGLDGLADKIESKTNAQALQMLNNAKLYIERGQRVSDSVTEPLNYNYVIFNDADIEIKATFARPNAAVIDSARDFISSIKPGDIAKVLPGNLAKSANETFPKIMDAMGWLFNVPVFQGERDARGRKDGEVGINDFVSTGIHRAENNMEFQLEMQGWDGLDPSKPRKTPSLWQRLKSATTQWESTDTSTEWGRIEQEVRAALDPKQQAALDIMQREGDVNNKVYETLADAMKNKRIAAAAPSDAAFKAYKRVRDYIDGPMLAARERLISRLGEATGADKELIAKTIASFRAHMGQLAGWMPRKHGEGVHQVNVHHVVKALPFRSAAMGDDHMAILPFYAGKDVAREIRTFARANGLTVFRNAIGAPIVVASAQSGEKIRKKIDTLESKLAKTVIVEMQEQLQAKIADLQAKLAIVERPPVDRITDFMTASKSFLTNIRAEYEVQLEDLRGQLEKAKADGAHISEIRKLKAEIEKLGDGRVKVKAYMRLNETQRRAEKHLAEVKGNLEKHLDHVFHKGEQYETTYKVINPTSEGMYGDIAGDFAAENIIKEAIERAQQHGRINNEDAASVRNALFRNYADVMLARGAGRHQIKRALYLIAGYDQTDTNQLYHDYMTAAAGMLSKAMYAKQQFDNYRYAPNEIKPWAEKYIKETLRNMGHTDRIGANVRAVATFMYLGLKMSSILVNGTQTWTLGVAELGRRTKQNSLKAVGKAQLDILKSRLTVDEQALFDNQLWKEQEMATAIHEMSGHGEGVTGKISKQLHVLVGKSLLPFQEMEMLNRRTMVLASYRSFLADGLSREDAIDQAMDVNRKTNFEMSRANLPEFAQHPVGRTAYALQSFVWNNWNWIYNRATSGEKADMLALLKYAAMISAIGGVAALAGGDEINKLLRRLTGKDYRLAMEIWTRKHAKEYGTAGELLNAMVWHGGVGALGVNISNAMRLNVPMSGFITGDTTAGESAMGIWSGLYDKGANAAKFAARGQYGRAIESASPAFVEAGMKAHRMATEGATTTHGKPILDEHGRKLKYSGLDAAKRAVGLQPLGQSFRAEATQSGVKVKAYWSEQRGTLLDTLRMADTPEARKSVMKDIMKFNKDVRQSQAWPMVNVITAASIKHSRAASTPDKNKNAWLRKTVE